MRLIGLVLVIIGGVLLLRELNPSFLDLLRPWAPYIKNAFWGVTALSAGLYLLAKKPLRKLVIALYVVYLILYLVG